MRALPSRLRTPSRAKQVAAAIRPRIRRRIMVDSAPETPGAESYSARLRRAHAHVASVPRGQEHTVIDRLRQRTDIEFAEPDYLLRAAGLTPSDPLYGSAQWNLAKINMPDAWALSVGSGVYVAVIDT